jgi:hypothetical protein
MKYHYKTTWIVRVDGRCFEESRTEERRDEIVPILQRLYPDSEVTAERKRTRVYEKVR